jgi:hypothetical protein
VTNSSLDRLTARLTAFDSFQALLDTHPSYRPTITPRDAEHVILADAFDAAMAIRDSERRAYRGITGEACTRYSMRTRRLRSNCPHGKLSRECCGYPEWLRVVHTINRERPGWIDEPIASYDADGLWTEEYPEFRIQLGGGITNFIQALTPEAAKALSAAVQEVRA